MNFDKYAKRDGIEDIQHSGFCTLSPHVLYHGERQFPLWRTPPVHFSELDVQNNYIREIFVSVVPMKLKIKIMTIL